MHRKDLTRHCITDILETSSASIREPCTYAIGRQRRALNLVVMTSKLDQHSDWCHLRLAGNDKIAVDAGL